MKDRDIRRGDRVRIVGKKTGAAFGRIGVVVERLPIGTRRVRYVRVRIDNVTELITLPMPWLEKVPE